MAAGQQKKRLNSSSVVSCNLQEQYRGKKKKHLESSRNVLNMRPHISLEWDDAQKRTVAKKEQIGITWRDVGPFVGSVPQFHMGLADVFSIPEEIFGLENLTGVLSREVAADDCTGLLLAPGDLHDGTHLLKCLDMYTCEFLAPMHSWDMKSTCNALHVWETHLSESERKFLIQFLPRGTNVDQVVEALLMGENFHFGNPFLTWGASLCSGNHHPDAVVNRDKCFRANKKAYYAELQKYHTDILENLKKWKDRWSRCKDPEKDIVEKMWRCRLKNGENSHSSHPNESREHDLEENHTATADSCSGVADEQVCISNKERTLDLKGGELQERKGSRKHKQGNVSVASGQGKVVINSGKEEKPHKLYVRSGDAAKYMSYFKISRKQHQLVKKIKQSDEGIQSKSLNRVLGDIKSFDVQPYKAFEEEEWKKLHEHWLQLACRDLPAAFTNHSKRQFQRRQWRKSLEQEIADKKIIVTNEDVNGEEKDPETPLEEQGGSSRETEQGPTINTQKCEDHNDSVPHSTHCPPLQRIPSLNRPHDELEPMVLDSEDCNQVILKQEGNAPIPSKFLEKMNPTEDVAKPETSATSAKDVWQGVEIPNSYYHPTSMSHGYKSSSELSPGKQQLVEEQPTRMIDLETNISKQEPREPLLHGPSDNPRTALHVDDGPPLFCSYVNQDHSELLPTFLKGQEMLQSFPEEPTNSLKQSGLQFLTGNNCPSENGQFPGQFQEQQQQQLFEERQIREKDLYLHQIMQKNMYSNGRYPTQELFSSGDIQEWPADPVRAAPFQPPVNGGMLGHNWFSGDHRARNGWSGTEVSGATGQCLEGGSSNTDGSLFSVLSQCNKLQAHSQNKSTDSKPYAPARNFVSGGISGNGDIFTFTPNQTSYSSARESSASAAMPWTNLPRSNPGPHDSIEKPFLRSWNK